MLKLLITNSETRKLLSDAKILGRNIFADAASNVAERSRPRKEEVETIGAAAPPNDFSEEPTLGAESPGISTTPQAVVPKALKESDSPETQPSMREAEDSNVVAQSPKDASTKAAKSRFQSISNRVPEKHKQTARKEADNAKKYLQKQFPKERQDQLISRLKKVIVECQAHQDYQKSISWLISQFERYFSHGKRIASSGAEQASGSFFEDPSISQAASEMRILLERLANGRSMSAMFDEIRKIQKDADTDEELREWWSRVDSFVKSVSESLHLCAGQIYHQPSYPGPS